MATNYKTIPAVGQMDPTACWAACLSWWLTAVQNTSKSQEDILSLFVGNGEKQICTGDGQIKPDLLGESLSRNYPVFKMASVYLAPNELAEWLAPGLPILVGFTTPKGTGHMNVIYDFDKQTNTVQAMEPWFPDLKLNGSGANLYLDPGAKFTGQHTPRDLNHYQPLKSGKLFVGSKIIVGTVGKMERQAGNESIVSAKFW